MLNTLNLYPADTLASTKVLFINFGEKEASKSLGYIMQLRAAGISAELFPDATKMKKQMNYANVKQVPFVAMVGDNELATDTIALKDMTTGEQQSLTLAQVVEKLK